MTEDTTHPLLSLPNDEIIQKLEEMNIKEILKFSLISDKTRDLVASTKVQEIGIRVSIGDKIDVSVSAMKKPHRMDLHFYTEPEMYWGMGAYGRKKKLKTPESVKVIWNPNDTDTRTTELTKMDFTMKNWMEHLRKIFCYQKIDKIRFSENSSEFDIDDIKEAFGSTVEVAIENTGCFVFNQMILHRFSPIEDLSVRTADFQDSKIPPNVLMENRACLIMSGADNLTLDEILLINSKVIMGIQMPPNLLNKFIKLWIGGSNPHMEHLSVNVQNFTDADEGIIMKGIQHKVFPDNRVRKFTSVGLMEPDYIIGGYDFHRIDGMKATIQYVYGWALPTLDMYVWFDHCHCPPPPHPLLNFVDDEIIERLREMSLEEILKFSLISERRKELVKSMKIKATSFTVNIGMDIEVSIETKSKSMDLTFYGEEDKYWGMGAYGRKKKLTETTSVLVDYGEETDYNGYELEKKDFTMKNWSDHLQEIFNQQTIDITFYAESSEFDIDDIKEVFPNVTGVTIERTGCYLFNQLILQKYFPIENLHINTSDFQNSKIPENILMQNFAKLEIIEDVEETTSITLNEILLINSKTILINSFHMSEQQLNKFVKLWLNGANHRMEHLCINFKNGKKIDREIMMKGIEHRVVPASTRRVFRKAGSGKLVTEVKGGMDIVRMDGVKATIRILNKHRLWKMFVWFDHCVVES